MNPLSNQTPDPFNGSKPPAGLDQLDLPIPDVAKESNPLPNVIKTLNPNTKQQLQRFFIILVISGVLFGGLVSIGVINLLRRAGLTEVPRYEKKVE